MMVLAQGASTIFSPEVVDKLLQYGALGIICMVFLMQTKRLNDKQVDNFQLLLNTILGNSKDPETLKTILTMLQNHNTHMTKCVTELSNRIDHEIDEKDLLINMVAEYMNLVKELKVCIIKIKNNNSEANRDSLLGEIMVKNGYITREQLDLCLKMQRHADLDELDALAEKVINIGEEKK